MSAGFALLGLFGVMLGRGTEPQVGLALAGLGFVGAVVCLVGALRAPRLLRLTPDGLELVSRVGVRHVHWREVRAVIRADPRREVVLAAYALQLEGDREAWLLPTLESASALRDWMEETARRAGLRWEGHRALRPARALSMPPAAVPSVVRQRRSSDAR
ncbi:MAG: hypothetical protein L0Y64_11925 [Myxococcaceae bacterium]|nr:hypothetical protein [Myxococcaceae bacterium]